MPGHRAADLPLAVRPALVLWLTACTALVLPFVVHFGKAVRRPWLERALQARLVLLTLELGAVGAWVLLAGRWRILPRLDPVVAIAGALLALAGSLLCAWARVTLGHLFSVHLGVRREHRLVTGGPYALVRHPIYLGVLTFILGSALVWNDAGLLALAAAFWFFFAVQRRYEEEMFARHFGADYEAYRRRVPALLPWPRPPRGQ